MGARGGLLLLAFAHTWPALFLGAQDGDLSLLWIAVPFVLLTTLVALTVGRRPRAAVVITSLLFTLAVLGIPLYLVGLLHLLQAALALAVSVRVSAAVSH